MDIKKEDLADLLNISEATIANLIANNIIPCYKINDEYRFNREEIEDWLLKNPCIIENELDFESSDMCLKYSLYKAFHHGALFTKSNLSKESIIKDMSKEIAAILNIDAEILEEMMINRESLASTGIGNGIAIPHARDFLIPLHNDIVVIVALENPIDFESLDNQPVDKLFFVFAHSDKNHLNLINKIVHLTVSSNEMDSIFEKTTKIDMLKAIKMWEDKF